MEVFMEKEKKTKQNWSISLQSKWNYVEFDAP